jgi:hypothetical protein
VSVTFKLNGHLYPAGFTALGFDGGTHTAAFIVVADGYTEAVVKAKAVARRVCEAKGYGKPVVFVNSVRDNVVDEIDGVWLADDIDPCAEAKR